MEYQSKLVPYRRCLKRGKRLTYDNTVIIFVYLSVSSNKLPANPLTGNLVLSYIFMEDPDSFDHIS